MAKSAAALQTETALTDEVITHDAFPALARVLAQDDGSVRSELERVLAGTYRARAPRTQQRRVARLRADAYDEPVLVKDISVSGVRLLVQRDVALPLASTLAMTLSVRSDLGTSDFDVCLVRVCGEDGPHVDIGCRFLNSGHETQAVINSLRHLVFR